MPFAYYDSLSAGAQRTYRRSDALKRIAVPDLGPLIAIAQGMGPVLETGDRAGVELQGLYEPDEVTGGAARITVWMRTALLRARVRPHARAGGGASAAGVMGGQAWSSCSSTYSPSLPTPSAIRFHPRFA